jgi:hypothetical protein
VISAIRCRTRSSRGRNTSLSKGRRHLQCGTPLQSRWRRVPRRPGSPGSPCEKFGYLPTAFFLTVSGQSPVSRSSSSRIVRDDCAPGIPHRLTTRRLRRIAHTVPGFSWEHPCGSHGASTLRSLALPSTALARGAMASTHRRVPRPARASRGLADMVPGFCWEHPPGGANGGLGLRLARLARRRALVPGQPECARMDEPFPGPRTNTGTGRRAVPRTDHGERPAKKAGASRRSPARAALRVQALGREQGQGGRWLARAEGPACS